MAAKIDIPPGYSPSDSPGYWEEQGIDLSPRSASPDKGGFYVEGPLDVGDRPVRLHLDHRRSGLQVYVKIQSID